MGNLATLTDGNGSETTWTHSARGQVESKRYADNSIWHYGYDLAGRLVTRRDALDRVITYAHNPAGLPHSETQSLTGRRLAYTHDTYGQRTALEVTSAGPTTAPALAAPWRTGYTYDAAGRLRTVLDPRASAAPYLYAYPAPRDPGTINTLASGPRPQSSASYDETTITTPFGQVLRTTRDSLGRIRSVAAFGALHPAPGTALVSHAYSYNAIGQRVREVTSEADLAYGYDQYRQVVTATDAAAPVAYDFGYDYDPIGNRRTATIVADDPSGDLITATYAPANALNQYPSIAFAGGAAFQPAHDANGNTRTERGLFHRYDEQDRLIESIDTAQTRRVLQVYDGFGRRVERCEQQRPAIDQPWADIGRVRYVYDGWRVLEELSVAADGSTTGLMVSYTRGNDLSGTPEGAGGIGGQLARATTNETGPRVGSYVHDANGNVVALLGTDDTLLARYRYSPFGETLSSTGPWAQENTYRFSAKEYDSFTAHYYYGFRYYNPSTGRWLSRDPIEETGGLNLYGMVDNDPINQVDPFGLFSSIEWKVARWALKFHAMHAFPEYTYNPRTGELGRINHSYNETFTDDNNDIEKNNGGPIRELIINYIKTTRSKESIGYLYETLTLSETNLLEYQVSSLNEGEIIGGARGLKASGEIKVRQKCTASLSLTLGDRFEYYVSRLDWTWTDAFEFKNFQQMKSKTDNTRAQILEGSLHLLTYNRNLRLDYQIKWSQKANISQQDTVPFFWR